MTLTLQEALLQGAEETRELMRACVKTATQNLVGHADDLGVRDHDQFAARVVGSISDSEIEINAARQPFVDLLISRMHQVAERMVRKGVPL